MKFLHDQTSASSAAPLPPPHYILALQNSLQVFEHIIHSLPSRWPEISHLLANYLLLLGPLS